jgi:hemoglobin-like flavoprotein
MDINDSMHRILGREADLANRFYAAFLERPGVAEHFRGVDVRRQAVLLTMALMVIERHYNHPYSATNLYLKYLGTRHCDRKIPLELFGDFREVLLTALADFHGADWDKGLAAQWGAAIDRTTETMREGYRTRCTV